MTKYGLGMISKKNIVNLAKSLYYLGKVQLTDRGPKLLGQQVLIVPRELFTQLIEIYANDPELERAIYQLMKESVYDFCEELDAQQDLDAAELLETLMTLTKLNGFGHIEINDFDAGQHTAVFFVRNLPSEDVGAETVFKGDTYWAGMLAGGMSYVFDRNVDAVETQCLLEGERSCRFMVAPRPVLHQEHPELYENKFETGKDAFVSDQMQRVVNTIRKGVDYGH